MRTTLIVSHSLNLVHNDRLSRLENLPALLRSKQNVEGFGCRPEDVRRTLQHRAPFRHQRVACSHRGADLRHEKSALHRQALDLPKWDFQIGLDVVAQGLERRDVQHFRAILQLPGNGLAEESINAREKRRERFSRTGRGRNQRGGALQNERPPLLLRLGWSAEPGQKPFPDNRVRPSQYVGFSVFERESHYSLTT